MKNLTQTLFLLTFPILLGIYAISLRLSNEGFQDIVGILMAIVTVVGTILAFILKSLLKTKVDVNKWYVNLILGLVGIAIAFAALVIYSRLNG